MVEACSIKQSVLGFGVRPIVTFPEMQINQASQKAIQEHHLQLTRASLIIQQIYEPLLFGLSFVRIVQLEESFGSSIMWKGE
ncbi:uncharacterized protein [Narcine bancroftii]|uniref:uncharacterized protein isoform X2 n=1 Tax=Narcine bancroftii TaxID=1343680 RepID=UPI0038322815